jgi:hypothetical protein
MTHGRLERLFPRPLSFERKKEIKIMKNSKVFSCAFIAVFCMITATYPAALSTKKLDAQTKELKLQRESYDNLLSIGRLTNKSKRFNELFILATLLVNTALNRIDAIFRLKEISTLVEGSKKTFDERAGKIKLNTTSANNVTRATFGATREFDAKVKEDTKKIPASARPSLLFDYSMLELEILDKTYRQVIAAMKKLGKPHPFKTNLTEELGDTLINVKNIIRGISVEQIEAERWEQLKQKQEASAAKQPQQTPGAQQIFEGWLATEKLAPVKSQKEPTDEELLNFDDINARFERLKAGRR